MNLKKTLFSAVAALALTASVMAPVAMAQPAEDDSTGNSDLTTVSVNVVTGGVFDVFFSSSTLNLGTATINSGSLEKDVTGTIRIGYKDTKAFRENFDLQIDASDFLDSEGVGNSIPASGFTIVSTENVVQTYWGGPGRCDTPANSGNLDPAKVAAGCNQNVDVGDLGYFVDGAYSAQDPSGGVWTPGAFSLEDPTTVQFGYAGAGTGNSYGDVNVNLHIPNTTVAGNYSTTVTFTLLPGTQPE